MTVHPSDPPRSRLIPIGWTAVVVLAAIGSAAGVGLIITSSPDEVSTTLTAQSSPQEDPRFSALPSDQATIRPPRSAASASPSPSSTPSSTLRSAADAIDRPDAPDAPPVPSPARTGGRVPTTDRPPSTSAAQATEQAAADWSSSSTSRPPKTSAETTTPSPGGRFAPAGPAPSASQTSTSSEAEAREVFRLTNQAHTGEQCSRLRWDDRLAEAAQRHSDDMLARGSLGHNGSDGSSPWDRVRDTGYPLAAAAENIASGQAGPAAVMSAWVASDGHRTHIVDCTYTEIGIGVARSGGRVYWTQVLATPHR